MNQNLRAITVAATLCLSTGASADTLYGTLYNTMTPIFTVNQSTGAITSGPSTGVANIGDLANGTGGNIWGVAIGSSSSTLFQFNPVTGATVTTTSIIDARAPIVSIGYDSAADRVYGTTATAFGAPANLLYSIDPATGVATYVGDFGIQALYGLAFNPADGFLYGTDGEISQTSSLYRISTIDASTTLIGSLGVAGVFDLAFRPGDNALFMSSVGSYSLFTADAATAASSLVGAFGSSTNLAGIAFVGSTTVVPVPPSVALMLTGLAGLGWAARRRRG